MTDMIYLKTMKLINQHEAIIDKMVSKCSSPQSFKDKFNTITFGKIQSSKTASQKVSDHISETEETIKLTFDSAAPKVYDSRNDAHIRIEQTLDFNQANKSVRQSI